MFEKAVWKPNILYVCACAFKSSESYIGNSSSRRHRLPNKMFVAECGDVFSQFAGQRGTIESSPQAIQTVVIALRCCISLCCGRSGFLVVIKYFEYKQLGEERIY